MLRKTILLFAVLILIPCISTAEIIDVNIKGVDDGVKTTKQKDYKEAVLFAKREAIERAGVKIKALTTAKDFVIYSDYIESKAEAALLPGYDVIDVGYQKDGTYLVILIGKVKTIAEDIDSKELRYAKILMDRGDENKAKKSINNIINNSKDDNTVAEAMYCQILWKLAKDEKDTFEKLKAYYPDSKYISSLEPIMKEREKEREAERRRIIAYRESVVAQDGHFVKYANGVVYDNNTGLEWYAGTDRDTNWSDAKSWIENLTVAAGGWRLPTRQELKNLYMYRAGELNLTPLLKTTGWYVWSDETRGSSSAWGFLFNADYGIWSSQDDRTYGGRGFAVRSRR